MLFIFDFPTERHERHGAMKEDQGQKGQDTDPVDVVFAGVGSHHNLNGDVTPNIQGEMTIYRARLLYE